MDAEEMNQPFPLGISLAELHQFAKFEDAKCLESLDQAPKGLHYKAGADRMAAAVILGEG
jgi:hypothetical protein